MAALLRRITPVGFIAGLVTVILALLIIFPIGRTVNDIVAPKGKLSADAFRGLAAQRDIGTVLQDTLILVVVAGVIAIAIGAALAWVAERTDATLGRAMGLIPLIPIFLPPLASAIGWVLLFAPRSGYGNVVLRSLFHGEATGGEGPVDIYTWYGLILSTAIYLVPYSYLIVSASLRNADVAGEEASRVFGAGLLTTLRKVSIPSVLPALSASAVVVAMMAIALFSMPIIIGLPAKIPNVAVLIYELVEVQVPGRTDVALALSLIAFGFIQSLLLLQLLLRRRQQGAKISSRNARSRLATGGWKWPIRATVLLYLFVAGILPLAGLVTVSTQRFWSSRIKPPGLASYRTVFTNPDMREALTNSLVLAAIAAVVLMVVSFLIAYLLRYHARGRTRGLLQTTFAIPSVLPHIIVGVALLVAFSGPPFALYGTTSLLLVAYVVLYLPQALQAGTAALDQVGEELPEAGRVFGASETRNVLSVVAPMAAPAIISGSLFVFALALTETNASIMLASPTSRVSGPTLLTLYNEGSLPPVAAFATVLVAVNVLCVSLSRLATRVRAPRRRDRHTRTPL